MLEGRNLLVLQAPGGMSRPYKAPAYVSAKHKSWHYYVRRYSSTVEAKSDIALELLSLTANVPWDDRFAQHAAPGDLSHTLMLAYLREVDCALADDAPTLSVEDLGRQMNVAGGPSESPSPKNVGILLFNETSDRSFPYTQIDVVWFPEGAGGDRFDEKIFKGPLARMTREALGYIQRNYLHETIVKDPQRADATRVWNFPYAAVEETLVNAVYHRSDEEREPVEVRISRDELVILSFAGPDRSIRLADFEAGRVVSRRYRNRRTDARSAYVIRLPSQPRSQAPDEPSTSITGEVTGEVARLLLAVTGEMTRKEIQHILSFRHEDHFRAAYFMPALAIGMLEMTLPDMPRSSKQRYRLTTQGKQWVQHHRNQETPGHHQSAK